MQDLTNEVFALRDGEVVAISDTKPASGRIVAVMLRSVEMPPGPRSPTRPSDGAPVEQLAVLGSEWCESKQHWQWCKLSQPTKETIGDMLMDNGAERDRWYYAEIK